jgi:hypothetical protein
VLVGSKSRVGSLRKAARGLVAGLLTVFATGVASASESYPGEMLEYLQKKSPDVVCAVPCTLCHKIPRGGIGTLRDSGFIENLRGVARLRPLDPTAVGPALAALEANMDCPTAPGAPCDSDGDRMTDMQELRLSRDPDGNRNFDDCVKYGCGASTIAPQRAERTELGPLWLLAALGAVAAIRRVRS